MTPLLSLSPLASFAVFLGFGLLVFAISFATLRFLTTSDPYALPIGAFIGTIATAWALSLGFVAADIWSLNSRADYVTSNERSAILRLLATSDPSVLNNTELRAEVENYRNGVVAEEWGVNNNVLPARSVEASILSIRSLLVKIARSDVPSSMISQLVHDFDELQDARNSRLAIGNTSVDEYKWYLLFVLTFLTAITVASAHADRPKAGIKALTIFALTSSVSLWILAIHANPYLGAGKLYPSQLFAIQTADGL